MIGQIGQEVERSFSRIAPEEHAGIDELKRHEKGTVGPRKYLGVGVNKKIQTVKQQKLLVVLGLTLAMSIIFRAAA
jgi:hypothetical protein